MLKQTYLSCLICIKLNFVFRNINSWARAVRQEISGLYFWCNWVIYDLISINPVTFTTKPQPSSCSHQKTRVFLLILIIKCRVLIFDPAVCVFLIVFGTVWAHIFVSINDNVLLFLTIKRCIIHTELKRFYQLRMTKLQS